MKIYVLQGGFEAFAAVAEVYILEIDVAVGNLFDSRFSVGQIRLLFQHFHDTVRGSSGDHVHNEHEGYHHQGGKDLQRVNQHTGQFSRFHGSEDDIFSAHKDDKDDHGIHDQHHDRTVKGHDLLRFGKQIKDNAGDPVEFFDLMIFPYISLDHSGSVDIFLHRIIQHIVLVKHLLKILVGAFGDKDQGKSQQRNGNQEDQSHLHVDGHGHDPGKNDHDGGPGQHTDGHHVSHLYVGDIRGQPGDQTGSGKMVYILKGKALHLVENIMAQILGVAGACLCRETAGHGSEKQSQHGHQRHQDSHFDYVAEILSLDSDIDDIGHLEGNDHFHQNLKNDEQRC